MNFQKILSMVILFLGCSTLAEVNSALGQATVQVNPRAILGPVNRWIFGNNMLGYQYEAYEYTRPEYADRGSGIWDPEKRRSVPEMVALARRIGMTVARWPGGCGSHNFNWKKAVGPLSERPNQKFGLPEFLKNCEDIGAMPIITVAEYWGEPQDGADLVEYLNAPDDGKHKWAALRAQDGHPEPYGVIWFEYGNESDHGNHKGKRFTPEEYGQRYLAYRKAMKAVDKRIKLGVVLASKEWNEGVLKVVGPNLDFVIPHIYIPGYYRNDGLPDAKTLFSIGLAGPLQISERLKEINRQVQKLTGRKDIPLAVTEFNGHFVQEKPVPYRLCLGNALIVADLLRVFMRPESKVVLANYWQFANEYWGMVKGYQVPYVKRPAYYVFQLYHDHFGDLLIDAKVTCPRYDTEGGYGVMPAWGEPTEFRLFPQNILPSQPWEINVLEGVKQTEEKGVLTVGIETEADLNYYHASKRMPAKPLTGYRVTAEIKTEGLETSRGAQVQIGDGRGWTATHSANLTPEVKSATWKHVSADYVSLKDTKDLVIMARRLEGGGSKGRIWIRNVKVQQFIPENPGGVPYISVNASRSKDGEKVFVMVINKHLSEPIELRIEGVKAKEVQAWSLTGPSVEATNEEEAEKVRLNSQPVKLEKGEIILSLPPHSLTAVEISVYL